MGPAGLTIQSTQRGSGTWIWTDGNSFFPGRCASGMSDFLRYGTQKETLPSPPQGMTTEPQAYTLRGTRCCRAAKATSLTQRSPLLSVGCIAPCPLLPSEHEPSASVYWS